MSLAPVGGVRKYSAAVVGLDMALGLSMHGAAVFIKAVL